MKAISTDTKTRGDIEVPWSDPWIDAVTVYYLVQICESKI